MDTILSKLTALKRRFEEITEKLAYPDVIADQKKYVAYSKERSELEPIVNNFHLYNSACEDLAQARDIIKNSADVELREMAQDEIIALEKELSRLESALRLQLIPQDPQNSRNAIIEIRAGTGGEEAALFAGDLYRMYTRYAERKGWKNEQLSSSPSDLRGFKEIIFLLSGRDVYGVMKFESGVHRVQRVPITEASGRIHTSAASVAVLPEAEEVEVHIDTKDIRVDVFRSSGPGGQSVNTTDSAVRVTHIPTGIVVSCQDEKSQHKNKAKALKVLRARLLDRMQMEQDEKISAQRRTMVSTGDRSAKIRTYNFPQNRITDHRINLVLYSLDTIMDGEIDQLTEQLRMAEQTAKLEESIETTLSEK